MKQLSKKGAESIQGLIVGIAGAAVVLVVIMIIVAETSTVQLTNGQISRMNGTWYCAGGTYNGTPLIGCVGGTPTLIPDSYTHGQTMLAKLGTVPTWIGLIIIAAMASIVLGYFYMRG